MTHQSFFSEPSKFYLYNRERASLVAQRVKCLPTMQETQVRSLGQEKEMATHSSIFAWRIPETEEPGGLPSLGSHRFGHDCGNLAAAAAACWS